MPVVKVNTVPPKVVKVMGLTAKQVTQIADIVGLVSALSGKADSEHDHDALYYTKLEIDAEKIAPLITSLNEALNDLADQAAILARDRNIFEGYADYGVGLDGVPNVRISRPFSEFNRIELMGGRGGIDVDMSSLGGTFWANNMFMASGYDPTRRYDSEYSSYLHQAYGGIVFYTATNTSGSWVDDRRALFMFNRDGTIYMFGLAGSGKGDLVSSNTGYVTKKLTGILEKAEDYTLLAADSRRLIELDSSDQPVTLTINPALFNGETLRVYCADRTDENACTVAVSSGVIKLASLVDVDSVELGNRQTILFSSNGTNLREIR